MSSTANIRRQFLDFFTQKQHAEVQSSSLIPAGDDTLLFTNAGMVQFKDIFLGKESSNYTKATSSQRCVRAGGKHNDLENVGYTARHHTFFEMLGNFSFGDYFKEEAIQYAWEFLTQVIKLPEEKLWVTVFEDDDEAANIWLNKLGIDPTRFSRIGAKDNFWQMGDTGPCGPCSEIFYDHGKHIAGGPPGTPEEDGDRYIEIWNLVFMQYNRAADGTMTPLPKPSVDTGMGLERLAAILQGVHSNYEIDIFTHLIQAAKDATGAEDLNNNSLKVIADHIRSCAFLISDGVHPSNEGRGYVLRRIIRRACRHGHKLGQDMPFFHTLVNELTKQMGDAYPELKENQAQINTVLLKEEQRFAETLSQGMVILKEALENNTGTALSGDVAFQLYDTYGFPVDLTADFAREHNLTIDMARYDMCMDEQRARARSANQFGRNTLADVQIDDTSDFTGYEHLEDQSTVITLINESEHCEQLNQGARGAVVLEKTPFYAESGGQIGDKGTLSCATGTFIVEDTQKQQNAIVHSGHVKTGHIKLNDKLTAVINQSARRDTERNHSATHLLHWALRDVLGKHVQQKGSLVNEHYLRFDFSHDTAVNHDEILLIEQKINDQIRKNLETRTRLMNIDAAKQAGALALFGEKYADDVRVLNIGEHSIELCGGTHVKRTGDIGFFKITSESSVASGVRRLEAVTGVKAEALAQDNAHTINRIANTLKTDSNSIDDKLIALLEKNKELEKQLAQLKTKLASNSGNDLASNAQEINGIKVIAAELEGADSKTLRSTLDSLKDKLPKCIIVLGCAENGKVKLIAGVSKTETQRIKAGDLVNHVATQVGGKGGGRPDMAQAGGTQPENLNSALASVSSWVKQTLS